MTSHVRYQKNRPRKCQELPTEVETLLYPVGCTWGEIGKLPSGAVQRQLGHEIVGEERNARRVGQGAARPK